MPDSTAQPEGTPLHERSALVTGSTQGLGLAVARELAAAGCNVVLHGLADSASVDAARAELERFGVKVIYSDADLRRPDEISRMMISSLDAFGAIDILVNNAVVRHTAPIDALRPDAWDEDIAVNLSAAFHTIRLALPSMKARSWGRIVNMSSIYGLRGAANRAGYVTTKTALIGLTRAVAMETADYDITCNAVCPGTAETPIHEATLRTLMTSEGLPRVEAERRVLAGKQPTGRFVGMHRVAALVLFLCGPAGADITGAALPVDGGWSAA